MLGMGSSCSRALRSRLLSLPRTGLGGAALGTIAGGRRLVSGSLLGRSPDVAGISRSAQKGRFAPLAPRETPAPPPRVGVDGPRLSCVTGQNQVTTRTVVV